MEGFSLYFLLFFIYSVIGYICEVTYVYFGTKKIINRGFLIGPYIPIYGAGALIVSFLLTGYYNDPIVIFVIGLLICTSIEYFTSYIMEKIFHNRWWDYSDNKYNVNGRVCLKNSILFGGGCLIIIYVGNPIIMSFLNQIPDNNKLIATIILLVAFIIDLILSMIEAYRVNNISSHLETILNEYTKNKNIKLNRIKTRLFDAYPYLIKNPRVLQRLKALKKDFINRQRLKKKNKYKKEK